jgi:hypothetical protein
MKEVIDQLGGGELIICFENGNFAARSPSQGGS